ncbi:hypothetical protein ACJX0J_016199, partial [Zea mays]
TNTIFFKRFIIQNIYEELLQNELERSPPKRGMYNFPLTPYKKFQISYKINNFS